MHKIRQFLSPALTNKVQQISQLTEILYQCVPLDFIGHCHAIGCRDGVISLIAESATWSTRLRYYGRDIRRHFETQLHVECSKLIVRVQSPQTPALRTQANIRNTSLKLPATSAGALRALAADCNDKALADALCRLAARANETS